MTVVSVYGEVGSAAPRFVKLVKVPQVVPDSGADARWIWRDAIPDPPSVAVRVRVTEVPAG